MQLGCSATADTRSSYKLGESSAEPFWYLPGWHFSQNDRPSTLWNELQFEHQDEFQRPARLTLSGTTAWRWRPSCWCKFRAGKRCRRPIQAGIDRCPPSTARTSSLSQKGYQDTHYG